MPPASPPAAYNEGVGTAPRTVTPGTGGRKAVSEAAPSSGGDEKKRKPRKRKGRRKRAQSRAKSKGGGDGEDGRRRERPHKRNRERRQGKKEEEDGMMGPDSEGGATLLSGGNAAPGGAALDAPHDEKAAPPPPKDAAASGAEKAGDGGSRNDEALGDKEEEGAGPDSRRMGDKMATLRPPAVSERRDKGPVSDGGAPPLHEGDAAPGGAALDAPRDEGTALPPLENAVASGAEETDEGGSWYGEVRGIAKEEGTETDTRCGGNKTAAPPLPAGFERMDEGPVSEGGEPPPSEEDAAPGGTALDAPRAPRPLKKAVAFGAEEAGNGGSRNGKALCSEKEEGVGPGSRCEGDQTTTPPPPAGSEGRDEGGGEAAPASADANPKQQDVQLSSGPKSAEPTEKRDCTTTAEAEHSHGIIMDLDEDSNARWLYQICSTARKKMGTHPPVTALQLSIEVLRIVQSIDEDDVDPFKLFEILKEKGLATRYHGFVGEMSERAMELQDDPSLSEEAVMQVADEAKKQAAEEAKKQASAKIRDAASSAEVGGDVESRGKGREQESALSHDDLAESETMPKQPDAESSSGPESAEPTEKKDCEGNDDLSQSIDLVELHRFQLRARVFGLLQDSSTKLWQDMKTAGWTLSCYSKENELASRVYYTPDGKKTSLKYDVDLIKRIFKHFDLDRNSNEKDDEIAKGGESDEESGPDEFYDFNDVVCYLDESCMPDYREIPAEVQAKYEAFASKSAAYRRRNVRLRFELLEVVYRRRFFDAGCTQLDEVREEAAKFLGARLEQKSFDVSQGYSSEEEEEEQSRNSDEIEQYFGKKSGKKPSKKDLTTSDLVAPSPQDCIAELESVYCRSNFDHVFDDVEIQYEQHFSEWSFSLATNQSILLYGLGSKISVVTSFGDYLSAEGDVIMLHGYDPDIDLNQFLDIMDQLFFQDLEGESTIDPNDELPKKAANFAKKFASTRSRPLFLLVHNIDSKGLRNHSAQDAIATLTFNSQNDGTPLIRIVATVDDVNASMYLWTPQVKHKFDWAWKKVHTYRPYFEEIKAMPQAESSKGLKKRKVMENAGDAPAVLKVLAYVSQKHTKVMQLLANLQLSSASGQVPYHTLKNECNDKMVTSSDSNLRTIMKELSDHNIIASERDSENVEQVFVPSTISLKDILGFKQKDPTKN